MLAIIGGTGLSSLAGFELSDSRDVLTRFAEQPVTVEIFRFANQDIVFLPRHGHGHKVPPHEINYRANIASLKAVGVTRIIAINAVGGIHPDLPPGAFMVPDQLIDYSHSRAATFFEGEIDKVVHVDFSYPFSESLRKGLLQATETINQAKAEMQRVVLPTGVYGVTQGPRLETAAEIRRLQQDGCDIVGMTAMPEAVLAREAQIDYAILALSVNWAAGLFPGEIAMTEIEAVVEGGMQYVLQVLQQFIQQQSAG